MFIGDGEKIGKRDERAKRRHESGSHVPHGYLKVVLIPFDHFNDLSHGMD